MPPRISCSRRLSLSATLLSTLIAVELAAPGPGRAQSPSGRQVRTERIERRIDSINPNSGPPGTLVHVATADMPVTTPIRVGLGAIRTGFEAFGELMTGQEGEFAVTVEIPEWATWDRVHRLIVFDIYFQPIALSDFFHVTDAEGLVHREGRMRRTSSMCADFEDAEGLSYALTQVPDGDFDPEARMIVEGRIVDGAACGNELGIEVVSLRTRT